MGTKKKGKKEEEREEVAEDWCFECYEGGLLLVCDYKHCLKSYHAKCVGKDDSCFETDDPWFCRRHSCYQCKKSPKYQCVGCPNAVCGHCFDKVHFARVRGNKGLCHHCLKLALLGEEGMDVDSDGECVDFKDLETFEGLFFDYWKKVVKEKEGLTLEDLQSADVQIKKGEKYKAGFKLKNPDNEDEFEPIASLDDDDDDDDNVDDDDGDDKVDDMEGLRPKLAHKRKRSNEQKHVMYQGPKSKNDISKSRSNIPKSKSEIVSWASNCLLDFLASVGEDTSKSSERYKIASIINRYANENKLFHPENPGKIVCDERLKCLFGRKLVFKNKIIELLELHFPEFLESSEEDEEEETRCSPKQKEKKIITSCKEQRNSITHKKGEKREIVRAPPSCFAFIVSENIKLVFLKRSLVQELLKETETFENKVVGSFVRVKMDSGAGSRRYSFQLLPVTGINRTSEENNLEILLQVSTVTKDISINLLSDDNFSEEECGDLRKKVKDGLIGRPTIVEFEQKARTLHEDITKHWIVKELATLQNRIDRANEKGWRREFFECSERQQLLRMPEEQSRLLRKVPNVIPDLADDEPIAKDVIEETETEEEISQKSMILESPETPSSNGEEKGTSSEDKEATKSDHTAELVEEKNVPENQMNKILQVPEDTKDGGIVSIPEENKNHSTETCFLEVLSQQSPHVAPQVEDNILFECELFQKWE